MRPIWTWAGVLLAVGCAAALVLALCCGAHADAHSQSAALIRGDLAGSHHKRSIGAGHSAINYDQFLSRRASGARSLKSAASRKSSGARSLSTPSGRRFRSARARSMARSARRRIVKRFASQDDELVSLSDAFDDGGADFLDSTRPHFAGDAKSQARAAVGDLLPAGVQQVVQQPQQPQQQQGGVAGTQCKCAESGAQSAGGQLAETSGQLASGAREQLPSLVGASTSPSQQLLEAGETLPAVEQQQQRQSTSVEAPLPVSEQPIVKAPQFKLAARPVESARGSSPLDGLTSTLAGGDKVSKAAGDKQKPAATANTPSLFAATPPVVGQTLETATDSPLQSVGTGERAAGAGASKVPSEQQAQQLASGVREQAVKPTSTAVDSARASGLIDGLSGVTPPALGPTLKTVDDLPGQVLGTSEQQQRGIASKVPSEQQAQQLASGVREQAVKPTSGAVDEAVDEVVEESQQQPEQQQKPIEGVELQQERSGGDSKQQQAGDEPAGGQAQEPQQQQPEQRKSSGGQQEKVQEKKGPGGQQPLELAKLAAVKEPTSRTQSGGLLKKVLQPKLNKLENRKFAHEAPEVHEQVHEPVHEAEHLHEHEQEAHGHLAKLPAGKLLAHKHAHAPPHQQHGHAPTHALAPLQHHNLAKFQHHHRHNHLLPEVAKPNGPFVGGQPLYESPRVESLAPHCSSALYELKETINEVLALIEHVGQHVLLDESVDYLARDLLSRKLAKIRAAADESRMAATLAQLKRLNESARVAGVELMRLANGSAVQKVEPSLRSLALKMRSHYVAYRKACKTSGH